MRIHLVALTLLLGACRQSDLPAQDQSPDTPEQVVPAVSAKPTKEACETDLLPRLFPGGNVQMVASRATQAGCDMTIEFLQSSPEEVRSDVVAAMAGLNYALVSAQPARRGERLVHEEVGGKLMTSVLLRSADAAPVSTKEAKGSAYVHWYLKDE